MTVSSTWPSPASDPDLPGRSTAYVLLGVIVVTLGSLGHVLLSSVDLGDPAVVSLLVGAVLVAVLAAGALVAVLLRPQHGRGARLVLLGGLSLTVALAASAVAVTGDLASAGLTGLAMVAAVTLGDTRWVTGFAAASGVSWAAVALASTPTQRWVAPFLLVLTAGGLTALLEAVRRRAFLELRASRAERDTGRATDVTTGLASREGLALAGARMVETARRQGDAVHCVFIEISGLDRLVDQIDPDARDRVLTAVAEALAGGIRGTDVAARWDVDVFCVVGPGVGVSPLELERRIHERLTLEPPVAPEFWSPRVTAAAATLPPWEDGNLNTLLGLGEQVMQVRRVLRGGRTHARRTDQPGHGWAD